MFHPQSLLAAFGQSLLTSVSRFFSEALSLGGNFSCKGRKNIDFFLALDLWPGKGRLPGSIWIGDASFPVQTFWQR
jgi:hypothetical protein